MNEFSRNNPSTISPLPQAPERGNQTYGVTVTQNNRRKGESFAQEGLGYQQRYHGAFYEAVRDTDTGASHTDVEVQVAGQASGRSLLGSGQAVPAWNAVDQFERASFIQGQSSSEQVANPAPFPHFPRAGANSNPLGPTWGFSTGSERPGTFFAKQIAPEGGGRWRNRTNEAKVTD
jgi:hypothetical protein